MANKPETLGLIEVPMDLSGSHWGKGLDQGPTHLIQHGLLHDLEHIGFDVDRTSIRCPPPSGATVDGVQNLADIVQISQNVASATDAFRRKKQKVLLLGGEQTADLGLVAGIAKQARRVHRTVYDPRVPGGIARVLPKNTAIISLDGHLDCETHETSHTHHGHGMTLASHVGAGHPKMTELYGKGQRVEPSDVLVIGPNTDDRRFFIGQTAHWTNAHINEYDELYRAQSWGIDVALMNQLRNLRQCPGWLKEKIFQLLARAANVVILCDMDHLHQAEAPGVAMPNHSGMRLELSLDIAKHIADYSYLLGDKIRGVALVEVDPAKDTNGVTARAANKLITTLLNPQK